MKKLYVFALENERHAFLKGINKTPPVPGDFFSDAQGGYAVIGVGKVFAAMHTEKYITSFQPDLVINVGVAGGITQTTNDWLLVSETLFHDVDVTTFGYQKGQYPKASARFKSDIYRFNQLKKAFAKTPASPGRVATGDYFMTETSRLDQTIEVAAVDMELAAIAMVCEAHDIPWVAVKTISDTVGTPSQITDFKHWVDVGLQAIAPYVQGAFL